MKKGDVLKYAYKNYAIDDDEFEDLLKTLEGYEKEKNVETGEQLAKEIYVDMPQLKLLHDYSMRKYAKVTASSLSVIKVIIVIYFICSIIVGIVFASKL
jgi:hypothetical protein